ncbi:hypothetical protein [Uliginosibacterium gangwonense]|uniref:hypothetical protein n=1 Tax=Uliginosibacterium gangwonense TaxID=392736 RepID=UPI000475CFFF|nr:hypothetical protein [Uliginosibacterium gangwonense]
MLTLKDCMDYCDITDEEVELFAEHEHIPSEIAGQLVCGLVQTEEGVTVVSRCLSDIVSDAMTRGRLDKAEHVLHVYAQFRSAHPLA